MHEEYDADTNPFMNVSLFSLCSYLCFMELSAINFQT